MTSLPDRDDQVMSLVATALALDAEERSGYLHVACGDDESLFRETREALQWEERMGGFLRKPWLSLCDLERPFQPGQVINQRFEIVREIGQGGMGIVYEAFDRKRGQRIAIKSAKLGFRRLLSPELESALRVRHPNICLVNEIHTTVTEHGEVDFLTMELLDGETLASRGKLPRQEALEIARQICAGVAEAHRIGVIHKDLKTANVIVDRGGRAVITDFGLAGSDDFAGTPRYMAPELWTGAKASKASDVYALGVILYELMTGATPFTDEPTEVRLTKRPPAPSTRAHDIDRHLDAVISRCLDPSPAARPRDASEVLAALTPKRSLRPALLASVAVIALIAGITTMKLSQPPPNIRLAILPVAGTGDAAAIVNGALSDVADRLSTQKTLVVFSPARSGAHNVDATHVLKVQFRQEGNDLVVQGSVIDVATQMRLQEIVGRYPIWSANDLPVALTGAVSKVLRLRVETANNIAPAAATLYMKGLHYLRRDQHSYDTALPLFRAAMQIDARSPLPRAGIVEALVLKYKDTNDPPWLKEAEEQLRSAEARNPDSIPVLLAAARLGTASGHYEDALENYKRVAEREPRNAEVFLRIAEVNGALNRTQAAIEAYQQARLLDPNDPEVHEEFGALYWTQGDYQRAAREFRAAIRLAPNFADAYTNLGAVLSDMGQYDDSIAALNQSLRIKKTARAFNSLAATLAYQKRDAEAIVFYKRAHVLDPGSYMYLMNLADSCRRTGRQSDARRYYGEGSEAARKALESNPMSGRARAYVAYFAARLGDPVRAHDDIEQALQFAPNDKTVIRRAVITYETLGNRERALKIAEAATPDTLREMNRQPDLAGFCQDPRFKELKARKERGG